MNVIFSIIGLGTARPRMRRRRLSIYERIDRLARLGITADCVDMRAPDALAQFCSYWETQKGLT